MRKKIIRITTIPISIKILLTGQLRFMNQYYDVLAVSSDDACFEETLSVEGVKGVKIKMTRQITVIKDLIALIKLIILIHKEKPDFVHTHTPKAGILGMLAAYICLVPNRLHTVAGLPLLETKGIKRILLNFIEKLTYACATRVYPNSFELEKIIVKNGYSATEKLKVIGNGSSNGINTSFFDKQLFINDTQRIKQQLGITQDQFLFCYVGRVVSAKGINELIKSFVRLQKEFPKIKLLLVGGTEKQLDALQPKIEIMIDNHDSIHFLGYQEDVRPFLAISDVFVFPSYREGFPNVVMQAGAMGLPSIVSNINGCNEIIKDGVNGIIIPPKEEEALYSSMKDIFINVDLREQLASNARKMIVERFDQQVYWNALLDEYKSLEFENSKIHTIEKIKMVRTSQGPM